MMDVLFKCWKRNTSSFPCSPSQPDPLNIVLSSCHPVIHIVFCATFLLPITPRPDHPGHFAKILHWLFANSTSPPAATLQECSRVVSTYLNSFMTHLCVVTPRLFFHFELMVTSGYLKQQSISFCSCLHEHFIATHTVYSTSKSALSANCLQMLSASVQQTS